ncbi:hypothetical protein SELMODRAFT_446314 [Selaginella moellendorffii]|uniref:DUF1421 domain-containing protein n=1 Tax=Selaginella moellendorffii TaxID=88036 RepID=D8SQD2_SELML|nr:trithorax group protein osa [Selaginella moellendorffii]EFJ13443.1 hypothetical protein SELMODRAFT_446314 [Selaginella moellendorffii]|eukprot:XP_002985569.1 trithorax group protein osa [Selaginella moellendorffii]
MDNQGMGSHSEPFFDLLQPNTPSIAHASGSSSSNYVQNGPRRMDSSPTYSFNNDDVLPSYDFQPLRSNGSGGGARIEEAGGKFRQANPSFEQQVRDPPVTYEKYESTRSRHEFDKDAYDSATAAAVERTMKKYADNLLRVLEGMGGRLSQLEAATQRLEVAFEKSKSANANNHGETDGRLRMLENMLREVQRGVQVVRDKQEINEAQFQLKLQQDKTEAPTTKVEVQAPPVASSPQQPPPMPQPPQALDSSVHQQQAPPPPPPLPVVHQPPPPTHIQQSPHPPQHVPHAIQQQQQQPSYSYPPQNPAAPPPPPPPPMQQPHPQPYPHQPEAPPYPPAPVPVSHPQGPPHHSQAPPVNYSLDIPSYMPPPPPPQSYGAPPPPPPRQHQQQQQQQQHGPPPPQMYDSLPGRTGSGPLALPPPPSAYQQQSYETSGYGGGGVNYGRMHSGGGGGGGGGYPHLPTAQPIQQSLPSARPASRSGVDDVIDKVAAMGFPRDQVRATVQRLTENGQAVDMNVVLDKLMNGGGSDAGPPKAGWFGR